MPGPATVLWGPQHVHIYNDAYVPIARERHPALLGQPVRSGWSDVHDEVLVPLLAASKAGKATRLRDFPVEIERPAGREQRVFDSDWSPLRDESDDVAGALQMLVEITERHRSEAAMRESEERQTFLLKLSDALRPLADPNVVQTTAADLLGKHLGVDHSNYYENRGRLDHPVTRLRHRSRHPS